MRRKFYGLIGLLFLLSATYLPLRAQSFNLDTGREPVASLDGLWRFHTGDNPQWASPDFDDSQWPLLRSDRSWAEQGYPGYGGFAWYRFTVQVPDGGKPLGLLLSGFNTGYQVYANGKLIGSAGSAAPTRNPIIDRLTETYLLPTGGAGPQTIQIALRVWHSPLFASWIGGGAAGTSAVGDPVLLAQRLQGRRDAVTMTFVNRYTYWVFSALVGLTILGLFLFRPEDREYLWFSILLLASAARATLFIVPAIGLVQYPLHDLLNDVLIVFSLIAALAFFSIVLSARRSFPWWVACIAAAVSPLTVALYYFHGTTIGISYAIWLCCLLPAYVWILVTLVAGSLRKHASARLLLAPAALLYGSFTIDTILNISRALQWSTTNPLERPLLRRPFPLVPVGVVDYIFVLALLIFLVRRFSLARQEETRLSKEMDAARSVQSFLVPATAPGTPGFTVESVYLPASEVGGDFFHVQPGEDGSLLIVVGDVSGKGLKAAMTVSAIVGALRNEPSRQPAQILATLNRVLHGQIGGFVTCCAALIEPGGKLTLANAGHLSPYRNGEELAVPGGLPLGILAEGSYEETRYQLAPGNRLTFLSDGVVEARNATGELYGFARSQQISHRPAADIAETARAFGRVDDITVVTISRTLEAAHAV